MPRNLDFGVISAVTHDLKINNAVSSSTSTNYSKQSTEKSSEFSTKKSTLILWQQPAAWSQADLEDCGKTSRPQMPRQTSLKFSRCCGRTNRRNSTALHRRASVHNIQPFYSHYAGQIVSAGITIKNWKIQGFRFLAQHYTFTDKFRNRFL